MTWKIELDRALVGKLFKLGPEKARLILRFLAQQIANSDDPLSIGKNFNGHQGENFWKYRVGPFRLIAQIEGKKILILVIRISNWRDVGRL